MHKFLGNGFQEVIYQRALTWELSQAGLIYEREIEQDNSIKNSLSQLGEGGQTLLWNKSISGVESGNRT